MKQLVKQYENALRSKTESEQQANAKCFSKKNFYITRYEVEKQVKEVYTISKSTEIQQELTTPMYCDILDFMRSIYQINESYGQEKKKKIL